MKKYNNDYTTVTYTEITDFYKKLFDGIDLQLSIKDYSDSININTRVFDEIDKCIQIDQSPIGRTPSM